jgi:hypothetical protein
MAMLDDIGTDAVREGRGDAPTRYERLLNSRGIRGSLKMPEPDRFSDRRDKYGRTNTERDPT